MAKKEESRRLAMELAEPIQEAAARLFEMYLREATTQLRDKLELAHIALERADRRLSELGDTTSHPARCVIWDALKHDLKGSH
jgi:hypothetical protein